MFLVVLNTFLFLVPLYEVTAGPNQGWPEGTYGLPKAITGCPKSGGLRWSDGWIELDMEDTATTPLSNISSNFKMDAEILPGGNVNRSFCVQQSSQKYSQAWPKGSYCINQLFYSCPPGMQKGKIDWDEEDTNNFHRQLSGTLPQYSTYWPGIQFYYCCQIHGSWVNPIELPIQEPFYLLPYASRNCQRVRWAVSSLEYIIYDTEDSYNSDRYSQFSPFTNRRRSLPTMYYCHYRACRFELDKMHGSFSSPKSSSSNPQDFEQCSWHIKARKNHFVSVIFHNITISNCSQDSIYIYGGVGQHAPLIATVCDGNDTSRNEIITSPNKDMYIVLTSRTGATVGFDAEYTVNIPRIPTTATTPSLPPATSLHTTDQERTRKTDAVLTRVTTEAGDGRSDRRHDGKGSAVSAVSIALPIVAGILLICAIIFFLFYRRRKKANREGSKEVSNAAYGQRISLGMEDLRSCDSPDLQGKSGTTLSLSTDNPVYETGNNESDISNNVELEEPVYCSANNPTYERSTESSANELYESASENATSSSPRSTVREAVPIQGQHNYEPPEYETASTNLYEQLLNNKENSSNYSSPTSTLQHSPPHLHNDGTQGEQEYEYPGCFLSNDERDERLAGNSGSSPHYSTPTHTLQYASPHLYEKSQDEEDGNIYQNAC